MLNKSIISVYFTRARAYKVGGVRVFNIGNKDAQVRINKKIF